MQDCAAIPTEAMRIGDAPRAESPGWSSQRAASGAERDYQANRADPGGYDNSPRQALSADSAVPPGRIAHSPSSQQGATAGNPVPVKRRKSHKGLAVAIAIVVVLAGGGTAFAATDGFGTRIVKNPFPALISRIGLGGGAPATAVDSNDPIGLVVASLDSIQADGSWSGAYSMDAEVGTGNLGGNYDFSVSGDYTIDNYDPNDLDAMVMHMTLDVGYLNYQTSARIDVADGKCTTSSDSYSVTQDYSVEQALQLSGVSSLDPSLLRDMAKDAYWDGDTIVITTDEDYIDSMVAGTLGSSGLYGLDMTYGSIENRYTLGDGWIEYDVSVPFSMSYSGQSITASIDMHLRVED